MSRSLLALLALGALALPASALAKKKKEEAAAPAAETAAVPNTPDDANSKKFGALLVSATQTEFKPTDSSGAKFRYATLNFGGDNTWSAKGYVEMDGERMDCAESGTWSIEAAESATVAPLTWKVDKTDCAGRTAGDSTRAIVTLDKSGKVTDLVYR